VPQDIYLTVQQLLAMNSLTGCFVDEQTEPVKLLDIPSDGGRPQHHEFLEVTDLENYLDHNVNEYSCRVLSICQRTSWRSLQLTKPMAKLIADRHDLSTSFWDLTSCFYLRRNDVEETFMVPFARHNTGHWQEIAYSIRYPELKDGSEWTLRRQSAILHRLNTATSQSVFVLISPNPRPKMWTAMMEYLDSYPFQGSLSPFWPHQILLSQHLPAWRNFITSTEKELIPIADKVFTTELNEPLRVQYPTLRQLVSFEVRLAKAVAVLELTRILLSQLNTFVSTTTPDSMSDLATPELVTQIHNHQLQCDTYTTTAGFIRQRAQTLAQLLSSTLSFHDQNISNEQNANMFRLNKSAVFITTLTLVYLPASFVATFFGMNFFSMNEEAGRIVGSSMIWIYVVSTVVLSSLTMAFYYILVHHHDGSLLRRLIPKVEANMDLTPLTRRFTKNSVIRGQTTAA
jgi:hypothetical protein